MCTRHLRIFGAIVFAIASTFLFTAPDVEASVEKLPASSEVEVVYMQFEPMLLTFDIDRQTGFPTEEGQGVTLDAAMDAVLYPSANDHFLYVTGYDNQHNEQLWVYATDATGVPQLPAVQTLSLADGHGYTYDFLIDPNGTLAYAAESALNSHGETVAGIFKFTVDQATGTVTKSAKPVATYPPNGPCAPGGNAGLNLYGFNPGGNRLYDYWYCSYPDSVEATYYSRPVNLATGSVGKDMQILNWIDGSLGTDVVNITPKSIVYFSIPNPYNQGISSVTVYPLSGGSPLFTCTASMLEACGYGLWNSVDPSGNYVFLQIANDATQIARIDFAAKKIVDTGDYLQGIVSGFAPDDALIYTQNVDLSDPWFYPIYVVDPSTRELTYDGGQISVDGVPERVIPALRQ